MTVSEIAERKKELSENFTIEELIDLYLASEHSMTDAVNKAQVLESENCELRAKIEAMETMPSEFYERHQDDCIRINQLNAALDVIIEKYANLRKLKGL